MPLKNLKFFFHTCMLIAVSGIFLQSAVNAQDQEKEESEKQDLNRVVRDGLTINDITISGNKHIKTEVILKRLPYQKGGVFDATKSSIAIHNIYGLGCFRQVKLEGEKLSKKSMNLHIIVEEKKLLDRFEFEGNKAVRTKTIKEKLNLEKMSAVDEETVRKIELGIIKLYKEENRHMVKISSRIQVNKDNPDKAAAIFTITEGPQSTVVRVFFKGNKKIPDRKLRSILFTRENWLFGFLDSAGTYQDDMLEMDKHRIEYFYRDHGYLMVKVPRADVEFSENKQDISVTFHIQEGEQFIVRSVRSPGDDIFTHDELAPLISIKEGEPYSQTKLVSSMNRLRDIWGEKGYIYADVYPQVKPDEESNEVDISFHADRGKKLYVNRINITGNSYTRDKVIRRQLDIIEGDLITSKKLNRSRSGVEYLSFFEREGVNWKIHRVSDELADLEMNVQEAKTGNFNFMLSYGSDRYAAKPSLRGSLTVSKANLFGLGYDVGGMVQSSWRRLQRIEANFTDPHILDSDISGAYYFYKRWNELEEWRSVTPTPVEKVAGIDARFGFALPFIDKRLQLILDIGIENIKNNNPQSNPRFFSTQQQLDDFSLIVKRTFQRGTLFWLGLDLIKDTRNHQVYPSEGYRWAVTTKTAPPEFNSRYSFIKAELEASYYTSLIGTDYLVLALHGKGGAIRSPESGKIIPYKELFHMGGQTTVRGFVWGSIGPAWTTGDPIGAQNAVLFNMELVFPLIPDYSMKAHFFYDSGAGWNTPKSDIPDRPSIKRDKFDLRHAVGFGLNLLKPMPAKIDWGFKLDRKKKDGESPHEFHLSMNYAW